MSNAAYMPNGEPLIGELLKAVSRSFYLTIRWLPRAMQDGVALGYLLARATDSVADTSTAELAQRAAVLERMGRAVAGGLSGVEKKQLLCELAESLAAAQSNPAERNLLERFGECLSILQEMPTGQVELIRAVLATIVEGQLWDLSYFREHNSVTTDEQTRQYTYQVAGCVGKFWTELGLETMGESFCAAARKELMIEVGIRYGCGLQLVNILRDQAEDEARGRRYLCSPAAQWMKRAERYLQDGVDYSTRLGCFKLRFASMLPALIGLSTLNLMKRSNSKVRVKVPRRTVYACMLRAVWLSSARRAS